MTEPFNGPLRTSSLPRTTRTAEELRAPDAVRYPEFGDSTGTEPDRDSPPSTPRWVKGLGIGAVILVLPFVGLHLTGNTPSHMPSSSGIEHGLQAP
jgi:hypothetical protein